MKDRQLWLGYHLYCYNNFLNTSDVNNFMKYMEGILNV